MAEKVSEFLERHDSLVITTHENPDPDGIGAELVFSQIANSLGKKTFIVNSNPTPLKFKFLDPENSIKTWNDIHTKLPNKAALVILDTSDECNIGKLKEFMPRSGEIFLIDHHEHNEFWPFDGFIDTKASSTCELTVELATKMGVKLTLVNAIAAFTGIAYDTGFFAYTKTTARTFKAALALLETGVIPYKIYQELSEKSSIAALNLEKAVLSTLRIVNNGQIAIQILRKEDLENCGANIEDSEYFINTPLKCHNIEVSVLIKQNRENIVRCSLRSKGKVNVAKIALYFGGGGHITASGFKSKVGVQETIDMVLIKINEELEKK